MCTADHEERVGPGKESYVTMVLKNIGQNRPNNETCIELSYNYNPFNEDNFLSFSPLVTI